jgi:hypothetical protein
MNMNSLSSVSSTDLNGQQISSSTTITPPATPANRTEPASIGGGFALQDQSGGKSFAAQLHPSPPVKDYSFTYFGAITEGHYTEF